MQSLTYNPHSSNTSLGERRGKSDLARFSLDLNWVRGVSDSARSRAYPSPPMSGSPPLPPRRNPEFDDRVQGGLSAPPQDVSRGWQTSQIELRESYRVGPVGPPYPQELQPTAYPQYQRMGDAPIEQSQYQHQVPQQQRLPPSQQMAPMPMYPLRHPQLPPHFHDAERFPIAEELGYSQKAQRKTKGHVASACVPCKRAHLRCDADRPCSRCVSNGKEDACIDVQHKKRGRPRLRDEREQRYEGLGQAFNPQPEHLLRRPMSMYPSSQSPMHHPETLNRSGPYRVLKSQSGTPMVPRYLEHVLPADANVFAAQGSPNLRAVASQELSLAYLNMDLQISNVSRSFSDLLGMPSLGSRKLLDIVASTDRDKVYRLQRVFEDERQEREPNYLPPIYGKTEEDRVIQSIPLNLDEGVPFRTERQELLTFQEPSGQQRSYQVRLGLAKRESTYYVVLILVVPAPAPVPAPTSQEMYQMSSSSYHSREANYGFRTPQHSFAPPPPPPPPPYSQYPNQYSEHREHNPQMAFRQPLLSNSSSAPASSPSLTSYVQPFTRAEYGQIQNATQIPRSETSQAQPTRQNEFRLPPLQRPPGGPSAPLRGDDRGGRVDIGGLLEDPEAQRKTS